MQKIVIWGTGEIYDQYITLIKYYESQKQFTVIGVTSNDSYFSYLDNYRFIPKSELVDAEFDWILICVGNRAIPAIRREAISMNIAEDVLLSIHILQLPNFNFEKYIKLSKSKISIIANNCWGGYTYKRLGLKARSPFYNMYEIDIEYLQFLKNAKDILMNEKLQFLQMLYSKEDQFYYPVFDLAGMKIYMNHYCDRKVAEEKWYERLGRMNWDNLFVMMYSDNLECIEEFSHLSYNKMICFTSLDTEIPFSYYLPLDKACPDKPLFHIVNGSATGQFKLYDVMELLLSGQPVNDRIQ